MPKKTQARQDDKDPQLPKPVYKRAAHWAEILKEVEFDLIFSTETISEPEVQQKLLQIHRKNR